MEKLITNLKLFIASAYAWLSRPKVPEMPVAEPKLPNREENLNKFCLAIRDFEGFYPGSRSFRLNNPGNIRYTFFSSQELGATGSDGVFAKWDTYEDGFNALKKFVVMASRDELKNFHNCTLKSFIFTYSPPSDGNPSERYTNWVCSRVGYPPETLLSEIV